MGNGTGKVARPGWTSLLNQPCCFYISLWDVGQVGKGEENYNCYPDVCVGVLEIPCILTLPSLVAEILGFQGLGQQAKCAATVLASAACCLTQLRALLLQQGHEEAVQTESCFSYFSCFLQHLFPK